MSVRTSVARWGCQPVRARWGCVACYLLTDVVVVAVVVFALVILVAAVSDVSGAFLNVVIIATYDVFSIWRPFLWLSHMETFFCGFRSG